jgi:uncharacterized coiled-coil protein SlyX
MDTNNWILNFFVGGFTRVLEPLTSNVQLLISRVTSLEEKDMSLIESIDGLSAVVGQLSEQVASEKAQVVEALAALSSTVASQQETIQALLTQVASGETEISTANAAIAQLNEQILAQIAAVGAIYEPATTEPPVISE